MKNWQSDNNKKKKKKNKTKENDPDARIFRGHPVVSTVACQPIHINPEVVVTKKSSRVSWDSRNFRDRMTRDRAVVLVPSFCHSFLV